MSPRNCLFSNSGKLGIRRDHPHRRITVKFYMAGGLHEIIVTFEFRQNWSSGFWAMGGFALSHWFGHWLMQNCNLAAN